MQDRDLTIDSISSHFAHLAVPAAIGMLCGTLYNVIDIYFAGLLSTSSQAGLAIGFQAFYITMSIGFGLSSAMSALVGNAKGRKDNSQARELAVQGMSYGVIASVILICLAFYGGPALISLVSEPGEYRQAGSQYFQWLLIALPAFLLAFTGNGILQARGDTKSMQRAQLAALLANIVLNPLLIYGIPGIWGGMGFNGIALSTVFSQMGVMVYILYQVLSRDLMKNLTAQEFRPKLAKFKEITIQMAPTTVAFIVMFLSGFVVQYALKSFGEHAVAGYGVALRVEQLLLLPVLGMTGALLPMVAQNFGAQKFDRLREAVFFCWKVGAVITIAACPILWFGAASAMSLFTDDQQVIDVGVSYLRVDGFILPIYMMMFSINSVLQGLKRPIWTLWISIYRQGLGVAFFIWVFISVLQFDIWGIWFGIATSVITGLALALYAVRNIAREEIGGLWPTKKTSS